jgi:hypothetical protein
VPDPAVRPTMQVDDVATALGLSRADRHAPAPERADADRGNRSRYAIGAVHKFNALDGAAYILENRQPFGVQSGEIPSIRIGRRMSIDSGNWPSVC